ncbi:MAG: metallophosphoesterase family protein [Bacteroidia bacterium]
MISSPTSKSPRLIAIGDVHGCALTLKQLLFGQIHVRAGDEIIFLGDLIDRGPDTKGVLDEILLLKNRDVKIRILRGNHEEIMLSAFESNQQHEYWKRVGGMEVLESFGVDSIMDIPDEYIELIDSSMNIIFVDDWIFVHAGLNFELINPFSDEHAMRWIRKMPANPPFLGNRKLIHGHTPEPYEKIIYQKGPVINLDAGCVFTEREGLGRLAALELHSMQFYSELNCEDFRH